MLVCQFYAQTILLRLDIVYKRYGIKQRKIKIWKFFVLVVKKLLLEDRVLEADGILEVDRFDGISDVDEVLALKVLKGVSEVVDGISDVDEVLGFDACWPRN
jgi:hypothetical protein